MNRQENEHNTYVHRPETTTYNTVGAMYIIRVCVCVCVCVQSLQVYVIFAYFYANDKVNMQNMKTLLKIICKMD